uniref:Uncharacterized protein LOC113796885 n=1 Tax=Dermatophagoides pteronyssinus TaxID=6956 RepID=A0A6P6YE11_DERPT
MPIFIESTYLIGFQYENLLTVLELYYYNHTIYNCAIFDMKEQTRKKESKIYIKKYGHNKSYSKHRIDYNLMLLIIHSCTLYALKRYTNNILIKTDNSSKFFNDNDLKKDDNKFMDFIAPKTKWCGIDDVAKSYWDLGNQPLVDICCREHDHCPIHIKSKQTKHGLHNNNMFMVSYCQCEQFFYDCLHRRKGIHYEDVIRELYFLRFDVDCIDTIDCNAKW